jgi:tungstate transport system substrate-binding protein
MLSPLQAEPLQTLRLATTTSVENTGLLSHLLKKFTTSHPYEIKLTVVGSGKALRMARAGEVDLIWVHSPAAEKKFLDQGFGVQRHTVMYNHFILAGPADDPAKIVGQKDVLHALHNIARKQHTFLSRGDDSGTHKKERQLWQTIQLDPVGEDWYLESGTGMADSLSLAEANNAYMMIDRATFLVRGKGKLRLLFEDSKNLSNPYSVIAVSPEKHPNVNLSAAQSFIDWLNSNEGQLTITRFQYQGHSLYHAYTQE